MRLTFSTLALLVFAPHLAFSQESTPRPSLASINLEDSPLVPNPWSGVAENGDLKVIDGNQLQVGEDGKIGGSNFGPSVAVGDLNGDGLPDLIVADSKGYIWFFPNIGTKTNALFGQGQVLPVWFGSAELATYHGFDDVVPRVQLLDFNNDGKLDLVVGTFDGSLYMMPNAGATDRPEFRQPQAIETLRVPTRSHGTLWSNYLAPCLSMWPDRGVLDLLMGEGSYGANSLFYFQNAGSNDHPVFNESKMTKIIPGMGREDLTPCVVDWNNDGKPDIICGERAGYINLFINTTADPATPTFKESHLSINGQETFGNLTTVTVADLNGNHLPNLIISNSDGAILYATNTGKLGAPVFSSPPVSLKGKATLPKIYAPADWTFTRGYTDSPPFGNSYELLVATSAEVEKGFQPPPEHQGKFALRAYVVPPPGPIFTTRYFVDPANENSSNEHVATYKTEVPIQSGKRYRISFQVQTDGGDISNSRYEFTQQEHLDAGGPNRFVQLTDPFNATGGWQKYEDTFSWQTTNKDKSEVLDMDFSFRWHGTGSIYFDDLSVTQQP